jgi:hypothetical protein
VGGNLLRKMSAEALYMQIGQLIETMPDLTAMGPIPPETHRWLGRAYALVGEAEGVAAQIEFQTYRNNFNQYRQHSAEGMTGLLYRALATVEVEVPASLAGTFVPAGNTFDAMAAVAKIFTSAKAQLLIVDPYLDEKILTEFASLAPAGITLRLLCDAAGYKGTLVPALQKWAQQYGATRPVEAKVASARTLHDRLVIVDRASVWNIGQSFNALAVRAPTSFVKSNPELAALKVPAFENIWNNASLLIP